MSGTQDFEWPQGPEADTATFAKAGSPIAGPEVRPAPRRVRHAGRGLLIATFVVLGHALALVMAQVIASTVVDRHPDSARVREASQLLDDGFPVMIGLHLLAAVTVVVWSLQASVSRRTFWLVTAGAMHCILVAAWWSLFELA